MKIYHHNDLDGRCAAAIAYLEVPKGIEAELIELDYKDRIKTEEIRPKEILTIVDFSFKPEIMEQVIKQTTNIIWLDHHKTAFEYKYPKTLDGFRDDAYSGCELAWKWFHRGKAMPRAVELIGDYDKWALRFQPECFEFYEGLKMEDTDPKSTLWDALLRVNGTDTLNRIIIQGKSAIKYRDNYCEKICHDFGYEIEWEGHIAFATNFYQFGSKGFGDRMEKYDFCVAYIHDGERFTVSLYSIKDVDVSEICKKYGGGGHKGAAGFVAETLPFKRNWMV